MTESQKSGEQTGQAAAPPPKEAAPEPKSEPLGDVVTMKAFHELTQQVRGLQGSIKKTSDKVTDNSEILARYQEKIDSGMSPANAEKAIADEDKEGEDANRLQRIEETLDTLVGGKATGSSVNVTSEANRLIQELELDANAPEVTKLLVKGLKGLELENAMLRLNQPKTSSTPPPKSTHTTPAPADEQALAKQYFEAMREAPNRRAAADIKAEYAKKGVNVDGVDFRV